MSYNYDDYWQEQEAELFEQLPKEWHEEAVKSYLGVYGDAIDQRIGELLDQGEYLLKSGHVGPSVSIAVIALEVMIHYFCVRPLVEGAFLSDLWAQTLSQFMLKKRPGEQRKLLVEILKLWKIDLENVKLANDKPLWKTVEFEILPSRNAFAHEGQPPKKENGPLALECSHVFRERIIGELARSLKFTIDKTGKWAHVLAVPRPGSTGGDTKYNAKSPWKSH